MGFVSTIIACFRKYSSVEGTANRREFWFWFLFTSIILCVALVVDGAILGPMWSMAMGQEGVMAFDQDAGKPLTTILLLLFIPPTLTVAIRRLHDSEKPGWWLLIGLTIVGMIPLLYYFVKSGKKNGNRYIASISENGM